VWRRSGGETWGGVPRRRLSVIRHHPQVKPAAHPDLLFPSTMKAQGGEKDVIVFTFFTIKC